MSYVLFFSLWDRSRNVNMFLCTFVSVHRSRCRDSVCGFALLLLGEALYIVLRVVCWLVLFILFCRTSKCFVDLACIVLPCLVLAFLLLSCSVLSCLVLSYEWCLVLSCLVLSCLVWYCHPLYDRSAWSDHDRSALLCTPLIWEMMAGRP